MDKELELLILNAGDLPTIPVVATKVMELVENENVTADEIAKVVASDPAVAARVLKISNSSFYGCQRQIQTLPHAIMVLGFTTLRSLVIAASVKQVYRRFGLIENMLWEHSFGAGLAARIVAARTRAVNQEEAFLGGLFHDIGKTIMNTMDSKKFQSVMEICFNDHISFTEAERQVYPFSHGDVGGLVVKKWNFPDMLQYAVARHHSLAFSDDDDPYLVRLTCVVAMANMLCHLAGIGLREKEDDVPVAESVAAEQLGLSPEDVEELMDSFMEAYTRDKNFFN